MVVTLIKNMNLTKEKINNFKEILLKNRGSIEEGLEKLKKSLDFGSDVNSSDEETDESEEFSNYISIKRSLEARLDKINQALKKIEENAYGVCDKCGEEISEDVLEANPASALCKKCKKNGAVI
jgi:DnaK suppressor protein